MTALDGARWVWFARTGARPPDAVAAAPATDAEGGPEGWLAAWPAGRKPVPDAVRMDGRLVDASGEAAWVSLVLPPPEKQPIFDDPAVTGALRAVLAGPPADGVGTFARDAVHFAGAVTVRRADPRGLRDDPFARVAPAMVLHVGAGLFGRTPPPPVRSPSATRVCPGRSPASDRRQTGSWAVCDEAAGRVSSPNVD